MFNSLQTNVAGDANLQTLAAATNDFSIRLLRQLVAEKPTQNLFVSPYSAATALLMAANGAAGQTRTEMEQVLGITNLSAVERNKIGQYAGELQNSLDTDVVLTTANSLWCRQDIGLKKDFAEQSRKLFHATIQSLDFNNPRAAEAVINRWASGMTDGRITGIADGMIKPLTDLILTNAIYFKGSWEYQFDKKLTKERPFHPASGAEKNVSMMQTSKRFSYQEVTDFEAVRLPYTGRGLAMHVFLPSPSSTPAKLLENLSHVEWRSNIQHGFRDYVGLVVLPRFRVENTIELAGPLQAMGIRTPFTDQANFSGMFESAHKFSMVPQKSFVEVSEDGTEAAALTAIGCIGRLTRETKCFEMIADRPFLFSIVDERTEMILFMGVVNDL